MKFDNWLTYYSIDNGSNGNYFQYLDTKNIVILHFRNNCVMKIEDILPKTKIGVVSLDTYINFMKKFTGMAYD
jgi:hypothetical protein